MLDFITKTAGILSSVNSPAAKQAAEALNGVLQAHAARRGAPVMTADEVVEFNNKLKEFLDSALGGKIPRGLKWRLLQLKDGHVQINRQLAKLEKQKLKGEQALMPAEPAGENTVVEMPAPAEQAPQAPAPVALPEVPAPVELPPLSKKPTEVMEESDIPTIVGDEVKPAGPQLAKKPEDPTKYAPQGTHAETWDEKLKRWMGLSSRSELIGDLIKVADKLDEEGYSEAADLIENVVIAAAKEYPSLNETRKDLYDFPAHNKETMREIVKTEVEENRKKHHLQTHQGTAVSQSRYSPDLPGVMMLRLSDGVYQDLTTNKIYDFQHGFTDAKGEQRAGGSIKHQTPTFTQYAPPSRIFEGTGALSKRK